MSYYGSSNPPPLPPRNPRLTENGVSVPAGYPNRSYPPSQESRPPPVPPRPPGYEIRPLPTNINGQSLSNFSIPPPPPGPPPSHSPGPNTSSAPRLNVPTPNAYSPGHTSETRPQSFNGFTSFPPPPPNPPQRNTGFHGQPVIPQYNPEYMPNPHKSHLSAAVSPSHPQQGSLGRASPMMAPAAPSLAAPGIEPTRQTPSYSTSSSNHQSLNQQTSSSPPPTSALPDLGAQFQSLTVENSSAAPTQPRATYPAPSSQYGGAQQTNQSFGASERSRTEERASTLPRPVTSCLDTLVTFTTTWYWHPDVPEFFICSRCYADHIYATRFRDAFQSKRCVDGKPRICRFSKTRMRDHLFKSALRTGSLNAVLTWMRSRLLISDCVGINGVQGTAGVKWYKARWNDIPGFVSCQACYEDYLLDTPFAARFEPSHQQPVGETWSCDIAVPFVGKEYEERGKINDWTGFVTEAKARLSIEACPQRSTVSTHGKKWFIPENGPDGLVLCAACYCDQVAHTGEETKWKPAENLTRTFDKYVQCSMGIFNIKIAMAAGHETKNFSIFWTAVQKLSREKFCEDDGIQDGVWYTLPSDPSNFGLCAGCYVAIAEPLGISQFFMRKLDAQPTGTKWRCCLSVAHPRFKQFVQYLLELYFTHESASFDNFASVYACIPTCPREEDAKDKHWYGWMNCTICPECYHEFAQHSPLVSKMQLKNTILESDTMCEMYSPRMRKLFQECSKASPPDPQPLLEYSAQRRIVWMQTVPQMRMMLFQAKMALNQQRFLNVTSSYYKNAGMLEEISMPSAYTYGMSGVGYGFANAKLLQGAIYGQQAMNVGIESMGGSVFAVGQLEKQWRAVE